MCKAARGVLFLAGGLITIQALFKQSRMRLRSDSGNLLRLRPASGKLYEFQVHFRLCFYYLDSRQAICVRFRFALDCLFTIQARFGRTVSASVSTLQAVC